MGGNIVGGVRGRGMDEEEEKLDEYRRFRRFDKTSSIVDTVG